MITYEESEDFVATTPHTKAAQRVFRYKIKKNDTPTIIAAKYSATNVVDERGVVIGTAILKPGRMIELTRSNDDTLVVADESYLSKKWICCT